MNIGDKIRKKREELGMTQEELAKKLGYKSRSSVNKVENSREIPMKKVKLYAKALDLSVPYLMDWQDEFSEEMADTDLALSNMNSKAKEYALKLNRLPKDKQEHIMQLIDMLLNDK